MENNKFNPFLTEISKTLVEQTYSEIKTNDKLLMAKLSILNHYDNEGYDSDKIVEKVKECNENGIIEFANNLINDDTKFKSVDDVINKFEENISDINIFLRTYCCYNDYHPYDVYDENLESGNVDGIFSVLGHDEKVNVLSNVSSRINKKYNSIYTDSMLNHIWGRLTNDEKYAGIKMEIEY